MGLNLNKYAEDYLAAHTPQPATAQNDAVGGPAYETVNGDGPFDRLAELVSWANILAPVGWTQVRPPDAATLEAWRRPDGTHPVSAKVLKEAPYVLVNWSEDSGLPVGAGQNLTKARVIAHFHYGQSESALAKALVRGEAQGVPAEVNEAIRAEWGEQSTNGTEVGPNGSTGHTGNEAEPARQIRLTPASAIKPRPVRWVWADRIPAGELTLTPGRGGVGKSTFHVWVIAHLTRGTLPGVHFGTPKPCIIAAAEDSWERTIVPRLLTAGADMDLVYRVDVVTETNDEVSISLPRDVDGLISEIARIGAAALSVDPVMSVLASGLDTHKDREVRLGLEPLGRLADLTGCAALGNAHFNKSAGSDPLSLIMGSAAFGNVARAALGFARDTEADDGSCVISHAKNNLGRLDLPSLRYRIDAATVDTEEGPAEVGKLVMLGESDRSVSDILRDRGNRDDRDGRRDIDVWLTALLSNGRMEANDVYRAADASGYSKDQAKGAKKRLGIVAIHPDIPGPWFWEMPQGSNQGSQESRGFETGSLTPLDAPLGTDTASELFPNSGICAECGEPFSQPGLLAHCRNQHRQATERTEL